MIYYEFFGPSVIFKALPFQKKKRDCDIVYDVGAGIRALLPIVSEGLCRHGSC